MTVTPLSQEPPRPRDIKETERLRQVVEVVALLALPSCNAIL